MIRRRALFGLIVAALAMLYTAGATTAAFACAMPSTTAAAPMDPDCGDHSVHHDCALACAPMCAAIAPDPSEADTSELTVQVAFWSRSVSASAVHIGPEPPPPRVS